MQPHNAIAVHQPVNTSATVSAAAKPPAAEEEVTAESLGRQLRAALPPMRLHSVSVCTEQANVVWLSEGALGPDEHTLVVEAIDALGQDNALNRFQNSLEDGRSAVFLPVRSPQASLVGLAMILGETKSMSDTVVERILTPQVRTVLQRLAVLMRPTAERASVAVGAAAVAAPGKAAAPALSAQAVDDILEFELSPEVPAAASALPAVSKPTPTVASTDVLEMRVSAAESVVSAGSNATAAATATTRTLTGNSKALGTGATTTSRALELPEGVSLTLDVQPFTRLRAGGRTRRFEVIARASQPHRMPRGLDHIALQRLLTWMSAHRAAWSLEPTSFTLNLSISTLEDERFLQFVASNLKQHGIAAENIGFEIAESLCLQRRAQVERFITLCDKLGCSIVIDDFSLDSSIVSLLRSKALRMVKIDPKLTSTALKDKLSQAMVVAIAQAVKVLGIHWAAKRVESQTSLQWLTAIGCDFAQGATLAPVQPLEKLAEPAL